MKYFILFTSTFLFAVSSISATCTNCNKLTYIENKGQWEKQVRYRADVPYGALFLEDMGYTLSVFDSTTINLVRRHQHRHFEYTPDVPRTIKSHAINVAMTGANAAVKRTNTDTVQGYYNYFLGNDKARWASGVHGYQEIVYTNVYNGIDWKVSSENSAIKSEWIVKAGKKNTATLPIRLLYTGAETISLENGALVIGTSLGNLIEQKPYSYQMINGRKHTVDCHYVISGNTVSFSLPANYNPLYDLVIDPVLTFSTYSGSTADNFGYTATFDSKGFAFAAGSVFGNGYPTTTGAIQTTWAGGTGTTGIPGSDIGITKYSPDGRQRIYSTYLGGKSDELPHSLIVNSNDELFLFGTTSSNNFPVTTGAFDTSYNGGPDPGPFNGLGVHYRFGSDIIVSRISSDGKTLQASTYIGGTGVDGLNNSSRLKFNYADEVRGEIDIDKQNNIYIATCTRSADFPVTTGSFQDTIGGGLDGIIIKMNNNLNTIVWSSFLGGEEDDAIYSLSLDQNDDLYVCGGTSSDQRFPITPGVIQPAYGGGRSDGFITLADKGGFNIKYSTYWGKADYDQIYFIENGKKDNVYVVGQTIGGDSSYIYNAAYSHPKSGLFITNMTADMDSLVWSTLIGTKRGVPDISPTAFLVDYCNKVYLSGWGSTSVSPGLSTNNLPVTADAFDKTTDGSDFWLMVMADDASALKYATFMGNPNPNSPDHVDGGTSRYDKRGILYQSACAGCGGSSGFPTYPNPGAVSNNNGSTQCNNAVFKFDFSQDLAIADFDLPPIPCVLPTTVTFTNHSEVLGSAQYLWTFSDGFTTSDSNATRTFTAPGLYTIKLVAIDTGSCNGSDSITKSIRILSNSSSTLPSLTICQKQTTQIGLPPSSTGEAYQWLPDNTLNELDVSNPFASPDSTTTYTLTIRKGNCVDTLRQTVAVFKDAIQLDASAATCPGDTVQLEVRNNVPGQQLVYEWQPAALIISGSNTATPRVSPKSDTTFTVRVTNALGCVFQDSVRVDIFSQLPSLQLTATPDTIRYGDTAQLNATITTTAAIVWEKDTTLSNNNIPDPLAYPLQTTLYHATATDTNGCRVVNSIAVVVVRTPCNDKGIYLPNAFSPNGDGRNDVLYVRGNELKNFKLEVYDRWGQLVFETTDKAKGWNGDYSGNALNGAVFGYYLTGDCTNGASFEKKGNITVIK
jgi:gliding motility-associated-like protein